MHYHNMHTVCTMQLLLHTLQLNTVCTMQLLLKFVHCVAMMLQDAGVPAMSSVQNLPPADNFPDEVTV